MATSSIFTHIEITDKKKAEQFITALEESEKAQTQQKCTAPAIPIMKDANDIRRLMSKRLSSK